MKKSRKSAKYEEHHRKEKRIYYQTHREAAILSVKKYQKTNKYKEYKKSSLAIYRTLIQSAKRRNLAVTFSEINFINWYNKQEQKCYYCDRNLNEIKQDNHYHKTNRLTIDRINNNIGYTLNNIVLACWICNNVKSNLFNKKEMLIIGKTLKSILK
jgi:hypothetical protein